MRTTFTASTHSSSGVDEVFGIPELICYQDTPSGSSVVFHASDPQFFEDLAIAAQFAARKLRSSQLKKRRITDCEAGL
jgi:hypothetical protein